jgi:hypothetical protein
MAKYKIMDIEEEENFFSDDEDEGEVEESPPLTNVNYIGARHDLWGVRPRRKLCKRRKPVDLRYRL